MNEYNYLLSKVHEKTTMVDFENKKVPCIILDKKKFAEIMSVVVGKPAIVDTNLNILQDDLGHVFVDVQMTFSIGGIKEQVLLNANKSLDFFEALADTTILALAPDYGNGEENIFMIQLPRPEKIKESLDRIRKALAI